MQLLGIMDYSLLVGTHDVIKGNSEKLRENALTMFNVSQFLDPLFPHEVMLTDWYSLIHKSFGEDLLRSNANEIKTLTR